MMGDGGGSEAGRKIVMKENIFLKQNKIREKQIEIGEDYEEKSLIILIQIFSTTLSTGYVVLVVVVVVKRFDLEKKW